MGNNDRKIDEATGKEICKKYMHDMCTKGDKCRFYHPSEKKPCIFCHDYQNSICRRPDCRYLHGTVLEEDDFKKTGVLPEYLVEQYQSAMNGVKRDPSSGRLPRRNDGVEICIDYMNGDCYRSNCRYLHKGGTLKDRGGRRLMDDRMDDMKRRRYDDYDNDRSHLPLSMLRNLSEDRRSMSLLEEENINLRESLAELRKRLVDLQATNEFLLEQNARLRLMDKDSLGMMDNYKSMSMQGNNHGGFSLDKFDMPSGPMPLMNFNLNQSSGSSASKFKRFH